MPQWSNTPPASPNGQSLPIRRTPPFKALAAIVTTEDLIGCFTHFYKGHTVPCEGQNCPAHQDGIPFRWHTYLGAVDVTNGLHFIFECTAQATDPFVAYRKAHGTVRGCLFEAKRMNSRPNGRVTIRTKPADLTERAIPEPPDLKKCMAIIWSLPMSVVITEHQNPEKQIPQAQIQTPYNLRLDVLKSPNSKTPVPGS